MEGRSQCQHHESDAVLVDGRTRFESTVKEIGDHLELLVVQTRFVLFLVRGQFVAQSNPSIFVTLDRVENSPAGLKESMEIEERTQTEERERDLFRFGNLIAENEAHALLQHFQASSGLRDVGSTVEHVNGRAELHVRGLTDSGRIGTRERARDSTGRESSERTLPAVLLFLLSFFDHRVDQFFVQMRKFRDAVAKATRLPRLRHFLGIGLLRRRILLQMTTSKAFLRNETFVLRSRAIDWRDL